MKFTLIILTILAPFFADAGGGGGLRPGMQTMMSREIVFSHGSTNETTYFSYGQLIGGKWEIKNIRIPNSDVSKYENLDFALKKPGIEKQWTSLQQESNELFQ